VKNVYILFIIEVVIIIIIRCLEISVYFLEVLGSIWRLIFCICDVDGWTYFFPEDYFLGRNKKRSIHYIFYDSLWFENFEKSAGCRSRQRKKPEEELQRIIFMIFLRNRRNIILLIPFFIGRRIYQQYLHYNRSPGEKKVFCFFWQWRRKKVGFLRFLIGWYGTYDGD